MLPFLKNKKILIGLGVVVILVIVGTIFLLFPKSKKLPEKTASLNVAKTDRVDIEIKDALLHLNPYALPEETTVTLTKLDISEGPSEAEYPELKTLAVVDIEPSVPSLFINPDDPGVDPGYIAFQYPCGQLSQEEQNNLSIASFENGEWVLLKSWCAGPYVMAKIYHLSKFSLVSLIKDLGNQLLEKLKEEFIPVEKIPLKYLYGKLKSIVFLGCKQITFPIAVLERLFIPANYQDPPLSAFNKIFVYFYDLGLTEGYQAAKTGGTKPTTDDWITDDMIPEKTGKEIMEKINTEPSMYVDESKEFEGKIFTESRPVSSYFVDQEPAIKYAQNAYRLGYGFGFEQGIYDNGMDQSTEVALASFYIKDLNQPSIEFSAQQGSIARIIANPSIAEKVAEEVAKEEEKPEGEKPEEVQKVQVGLGQIAFVRDDNIWMMDPNGNNQKQLTFDSGYSDPSWSPDAKQIVCVREDSSEGSQIWLIDVEKNTSKKLSIDHSRWAQEVYINSPVWSPGGKAISCFNHRHLSVH